MIRKFLRKSAIISFFIVIATLASSNTSISYEKEYYSTNIERLEHIIKTELGIDRADLVLKYNLLNLKKDEDAQISNYEHASFLHFLNKDQKLDTSEFKDLMDNALADLKNLSKDKFKLEILAVNLQRKIEKLADITSQDKLDTIKNQPDFKDRSFLIKTLCNNKIHDFDKQFACLAELDDFYTSLPAIEPLQNARVTSTYGSRLHPISKSRALHKGVDLVGDIDKDVRVTAPGIVKEAYKNGSYGNMVVVEHKYGISTLYAHLDDILVQEGDTIEAGEIIGIQGHTGRAHGNHLHYEIRVNDKQINPANFLKMLKIG
jgi:murein DD-endopeptidase MepM/ murein hydrolase activator NlpD